MSSAVPRGGHFELGITGTFQRPNATFFFILAISLLFMALLGLCYTQVSIDMASGDHSSSPYMGFHCGSFSGLRK